jgi:hypothetical protein
MEYTGKEAGWGAGTVPQYNSASTACSNCVSLLLTAYGAALLLAPRDEPPLPLLLGALDDSLPCFARSSSDLSSNEDAMLAVLLCLLVFRVAVVRSKGYALGGLKLVPNGWHR